ncbi:MAG: alpha/beta hydrolase-fold protein [Bifidobacterium longum]|nr:alpha/beta hydrolase-fold protein [Bifidobacterium longum]
MKNSVWKTFMELSLVRGIVPWTVFGLTAIAAIILIVGLALSKSKKRGRLHPLIVSLIAAVLAGAAGLLVAWLVSDVFMVFGVSLGWPVIFTIAGGIAGVGFVIAAAVTLRGVRRALAVVLVPLVLLSTALGVDSIYGEYQTIGTLVGYTPYASLGSIEVHKAAMSVSDWHSKARKGSLPSMPSQGKVLTVDIPNTESNFTARKAMIYLPPAALSDRPPALPVMELLAGQPGSPSRLIDAGNIAATMNAYAAKHDGLAPIVLVPDQNGEATHNSLCADTTQGNAETYLTTDVVNWAKKMLPVAKSARMWAMGGFSQGGTCTTQLVPRHPDIYGAMLPVDGELKPTNGSVAKMVQEYFAGDRKAYDELKPTNGSVAKMVQEYFAGDRKAYDEQVPVNAIAATGTPEQALFTGAGERDKESISNMRTIADAARKAGMEVTELIVPGTGHDWHAVQAVWRPGLDWFGERTGLGEMTKSLKEYPQVEVLQ